MPFIYLIPNPINAIVLFLFLLKLIKYMKIKNKCLIKLRIKKIGFFHFEYSFYLFLSN